MSRYNTGNPIDSGALKDLSDNAKNLDAAMNKTGVWRDRFNVSRLSLIDAISRASSGAPLFATLAEGMAATEIGAYFSVYEQNGDTEIRKKTTAYASILIKSDADLKLDIGFIATRSTVDTENIKSSATVIQGYRLNGGVSPSITANSSYAVMTVPVTEGGYYAVNFGRIVPGQDFIVATSSVDDFSGSTKKTLNVIQKSTLSIVYVPPKLGLEYIVFNVKSPSLDIENSVVVQEYPDEFIEVYKIDGHALHSDIDTSAFLKSSTDLINVFDNGNDVLTGRYIHTSGEMRVLAGVDVAAVEVVGGETLAFDFYDAGVIELDHQLCYFNKTKIELADSTSNIAPDAKLTASIAYDKFGEKLRLITVPDGSSGYILTNVNIQPFDIRTKLQVFKILISDLEVRPAYTAVKTAETYGNLTNKKWVAIGDSITEVNFRSRKNYHKFIQQKSSGLQIENMGRSGTGFYNRFNVADDVTTVDPDIITVFLGTNDYGNIGNNNLPLGVISDATNATISGRVTILLEGLIDKFYNARIALITPIPRLDSYGSDSVVNEQGYNLKMLSDLLVEKCAGLGIPVLNLYEQSSLPVFNPSGNDYFFTAPKLTVADGLHPNDDGHRVLSTKIGSFLCSI